MQIVLPPLSVPESSVRELLTVLSHVPGDAQQGVIDDIVSQLVQALEQVKQTVA